MGPPNPTVTSTIPNVVGLSLLDAMKKLVAAQCGVGTISWQLSATAPSTVLSQSPAAGGPVTEWTDVSLVFSSGPSITYPNTGTLTVPNVVT
jgi:beta-lactam-binding protein with PASTA domain